MHLLSSTLPLFVLSLPLLSSSLAADTKPAPKPCTIHSPSTGSYYDLRALDLSLQQSTKTRDSRTESWHARGYDYPANFTLNFCGPVIESLEDVAGIPKSRWQNVSAFYKTEKDKTYSIGQSNSELVFRGRKLLLNYTNGSPCPDLDSNGNPKVSELRPRKIIDDDNDDDDEDNDEDDKLPQKPPSKSSNNRRRSTLLSLLCDRDPTLSTHPSLSFLGSPDHCVYVFEARSRHFCGGTSSSSEPGSLGPGGVFGVIILIALLAYLVGGCAYQRIVMRQRGWRQCPNYAVWMGLVGFVKDITTILFSSCTRHLPSFGRAFNSRSGRSSSSGGGYHRVGEDGIVGSGGGRGRGGGRSVNGSAVNAGVIGRGRVDEEENRLIDQLDEEWDD